jgi:hypothetical protein
MRRADVITGRSWVVLRSIGSMLESGHFSIATSIARGTFQ